MSENTVATTGGTRQAKKDQLAMRRQAEAEARDRHPAGTAEKAPAKPAATPPAEKASKPAAPKIRWVYDGERGKSPQTGTATNGTTYAILMDGDDKWQATVKPESGKAQVITQGVSINAAYAACIRHSKGEPKASAA